MSGLDILIIFLCVGALALGWRKGAIAQLGSIAGVVAGVIAARMAGARATAILAGLTGARPEVDSVTAYALQAGGYIAVFALVWLAVWVLSRMLRKATHALHLGLIDRVAGSLFLCFKWMLVLSLCLNLWWLIEPAHPLADAEARAKADAPVALVAEMTPWALGFLREATTNMAAPPFINNSYETDTTTCTPNTRRAQ